MRAVGVRAVGMRVVARARRSHDPTITMKKKPRSNGPADSLPARRCAAGSSTRPRLVTLFCIFAVAATRRFCWLAAETCARHVNAQIVRGQAACVQPLQYSAERAARACCLDKFETASVVARHAAKLSGASARPTESNLSPWLFRSRGVALNLAWGRAAAPAWS